MKREKNKLQIRNSTAEFLIFTRQAGEDSIEVRVAGETVWLTQKLMAVLFEVTIPTINEHLSNLYSQGEIVKVSTIRNFRTVQKEGGREVARNVDFYNLDAIIAVGFRVNSARAIQFRQWATGVLRDYAIRDYRKATGNLPGTAELLMTYVENGTRLTHDYGDMDERFYDSVESALDELASLLRGEARGMYPQFRRRLARVEQMADGVGWGLRDFVGDVVRQLEEELGGR